MKGLVSTIAIRPHFHAVVIKFDDHEEILYQELLSSGMSYIYTPDASINNGRLMVLSEESELAH